jgi:hypothetical protein
VVRGLLLSFSDPNYGIIPTAVPFQYNPSEVTRTIKANGGTPGGPGLRVSAAPAESYALKLELDALDALNKAITSRLGVQPLMAAIEAMLEPSGSLGLLQTGLHALQGAVSVFQKSSPAPIPSPSLPLVVLAWNAVRVVPVRIDSYSAHETGFSGDLLPVQATVDLSLTVLRETDLGHDQRAATFLASAYQATRTAMALTGVAQGVELLL